MTIVFNWHLTVMIGLKVLEERQGLGLILCMRRICKTRGANGDFVDSSARNVSFRGHYRLWEVGI